MNNQKNRKTHLDTAFEEWIEFLGPCAIGRMLNISSNTVTHWKQGRVLPRPTLMKRIKELTGGKVTYLGIIEGSCSPLSK